MFNSQNHFNKISTHIGFTLITVHNEKIIKNNKQTNLLLLISDLFKYLSRYNIGIFNHIIFFLEHFKL